MQKATESIRKIESWVRSQTSTRGDNIAEQKWLTLAAMSLGFGIVQLDVTIVNTALNAIGASLSGGVSALQWVVNTYTIAFAAFILTAGALGDKLGAKRVFIAGFVIFTLSSLACALSTTATVLIVARAFQGLGAAILVPNSLVLLNHTYPEDKERGRAVAAWAAGASLALTAGPLAGGALIAVAGWRSIFLVNVPIGIAAIWLTLHHVTETPGTRGREIDLPGQVLAITALGCLAGGMIEAGAVGISSPWVWGAFTIFAASAILFVLQELRADQPMLPLSLFRRKMFALTSLIGLLANIAFYGLIFVLSLYFQRIEHWSAFETGLAFVPMMGVVLPANLLGARFAERFGTAAAIAIGAVIAATGCAGLIISGEVTSYLAIFPQLLAMGGGLGLLVPPLTSALLGSVDKPRSGIASGVLNATRQSGSVIGVALFGSLVAQRSEFIAGLHEALIISIALLLASALIASQARG